MANQDNFNLNSLKWVKQEIDTSLASARESIQRYADGQYQQQVLDESLQALGEALGTLEIAELNGGALLAREIREVLRALREGKIRDADKSSRLAVRALIQLPDYLDYIELGNPDVPVVLVNIINELRVLRRAELLSDEIADIPGLKNDEALLSRQPHAQESMESLTGIARQVFELGLLGWYRSKDVEASLYKMAIVCRRLKNASNFSASRRLWWVSEAIICGLRSRVLPDSSALKLLIGRIDRQIKQLEAMGEQKFAAAVPQPLVRSLLYYVAMAHPGNKALDQVRQAYFLQEGDAGQHILSAAQISIGGQNTELYRSLSRALQEKLTEIKDLLEIYVHGEPRSRAQLEPVFPLLKDLSGTMNMLGMKHQERFVNEHLERLQSRLQKDELPGDKAMAELAEMLVGVESAVQAFSMLGPALLNASESSHEQEGAAKVQGMVDDEEFRHIRATVIQESQQNLDRCKEAIQEYAANPNVLTSLDPVPDTIGQISGAMLLVSQERVAELLDAIGRFVQQRKGASKIISHAELEHLAEAISAIDVYLEILDTSGIEQQQYLSRGMAAVALLDESAAVADADPTGVFAQPESADDATDLFNPETLVVDFNTLDEEAPEKPKKAFEVSIVRDDQKAVEPQEPVKDEDLDSLVYGEESFDDVAEESGSESMLMEAATLTIAGLAGDEQLDILELDDEISGMDQEASELPQFDVQDDEAVELPDDDPFAGTAFMADDLDAVVSELGTEPEEGESEETLAGDIRLSAEGDTLAGLDASLLDMAEEDSPSETGIVELDEGVTQIQIEPVSVEAEFPAFEENSVAEASGEGDAGQAATEVVDLSDLVAPADDTLSAMEIDDVSTPDESGATVIVDELATPLVEAGESEELTGELVADGLSISGIEVEELSGEPTGEIKAFPVIETSDQDHRHEAEEEAHDTLAAMEFDEGLVAEEESIAAEEAQNANITRQSLEESAALTIGESLGESSLITADNEFVEADVPSEEISPIQDLLEASEDLPGQTGVQKLDLENLWEDEQQTPVEPAEEDEGVLTFVDILPDDEIEIPAEPLVEEEFKADLVGETAEQAAATPDVFTGLSVRKPGADEEIFDIFLEEFAEESAVLSSHFPKWREQPDNRDVLLTMRRSFHTLKGSARLVGAEIAGEYAWLHEDILNQIIESSRVISPQIVSCIGEGVALLPELLEQLKDNTAPNAALLSHAKRAETLARGEAEEAPHETIAETEEGESPDTLMSAAEDPVLMQIFIDEAEMHIRVVNSDLEQLDAGADTADVKESLFRSIHTLNGSARTAKVSDVYEASAAFERFLGLKFQHSSPLSKTDIELLSAFSEHVSKTLVALKEGGDAPDASGLIVTAEELARELADIVEKPEVGYTQVIDEEAVSDVAGNQESLDAVPPSVAEEDAAMPEVSGELIEVFLGECEEILEHCDAAMQRWKQDPADMGVVRELYRELHTLKGSARMAGLEAVGDLSHAIENLLTAVEAGSVSVDKTLFTVVYGAFDRFGEMNEAIRTGREVASANAIIDLMAKLQEGRLLSESDLAVLRFAEPVDVSTLPVEQEVPAVEEGEVDTGTVSEFMSHLSDLTPSDEGQGAGGQLMVSRLQDSVKVNPELLDQFVDNVGEINILHSRVEQQMSGFGFNLHELERTVSRLTEQLRRLEMEAEAQILHRFDGKSIDPDQTGINEQFDPLELDRYSTIQQLSRSLAESTSDLLSIH
ncbi:MAG TPA: hypothetical protein ENJ35_01240, partial [Gammaproteobacteria bacterium]|nr:hypothetical protein [Gammaproteobacteria bacterium]